MSKDERTITIHAAVDSTKPSGFRFWMMEGGVQDPPLEFNKTNDKLKKAEYYTLNFLLDGTNNAGLKFSKDPKKVMWAKYVAGPTSPCVDAECHLAEIFVDPATPISDNAVTVINVDRTTNFFAIGFNFLPQGEVDGPTANYVLYDPIGGNQDGGVKITPGGGSSAAVAFGVGLITGAVGTAVVAGLLS